MIGFVEAVEIAGSASGQEALLATAEFNMFRGAIIASLFVGLAFLAGFAVLRRGALSYSAAFMVGTAAALEMFWLGLFAIPNSAVIVLLQGVFAASVIIFLSASIRLARNSAMLGGVMFAASLVFIGIGIINFLGRADFSNLMLRGLGAVGVFAFLLSAVQAFRGDHGARLILPGAVLTAASVFLFVTAGGGGLLGHGLFTLGILTASLVALTDKVGLHASDYIGASGILENPQMGTQMRAQTVEHKKMEHNQVKNLAGLQADPGVATSEEHGSELFASSASDGKNNACAIDPNVSGRKPAISSERLLEVLDFSGIGVWDWSLDGVYQSRSLCSMLGSDCEADFTPEAMRAFVSPSHLSVFEKEVLGHTHGDGGFDAIVKIHDGRSIRIRGARAVDANGRLERVVAFFEAGDDKVAISDRGTDHSTSLYAVPNLHQEHEENHDAVSDPKEALQAVGVTPSKPEQGLQAPHAGVSALSFSPVMAFVSKEIIGYRINSPEDNSVSLSSDIDGIIGMSASFLADEHQEARQSNSVKRLSSDAYIAMPVSWGDINRAGFLEDIQDAIRTHGMPYGALVMELSGLSGIRDARGAKALFSQLRQTGARIAFADPDADSAVLGNLHRYDFDYIRMNEGYVDGLNGNEASGRNAKTLITLGRDLGLRVVASGIETEKSFSKLRKLGCTHGDGTILAVPLHKALENNAGTLPKLDTQEDPEIAKVTLFDEQKQPSDARSLDDWSANGAVTSASTEGVDEADAAGSLPSIRAAFANSVPSFEAEARSELSEETSPARDSKLPKWRTWGRQMR